MWILLFLSIPMNSTDGVVMGWFRTYPTEVACQSAALDIMVAASRVREYTHIPMVRCFPATTKE